MEKAQASTLDDHMVAERTVLVDVASEPGRWRLGGMVGRVWSGGVGLTRYNIRYNLQHTKIKILSLNAS